MQTLREYYKRLKQWQQKPFDYEFTTDELNHCCNCGHDFTGNYCPYCSQKADEGPIGWDSVRRSVMDIWGLGSRSLPNTVKQLLLRPGYLISDYISGKRQVSFPPVKMLFIVAVIVVFWVYYLLPLFLGDDFDVYGGTTSGFGGFNAWNKGHFVWNYFIMALFYLLPTWLLFRYAPRHTRHTLPQGFFIQIFLLILNLLVSFLALTPLIFWNYNIYSGACLIVLVIYYTITYRQLFGYGTWGTLWRLLFVLGSVNYVIFSIVAIFFDVDPGMFGKNAVPINKYYYAGGAAFWAILILFIGWIINLIVTRKARKQLK